MGNDGTMDLLPKKESLQLGRELEKLQRNLGGIRTMNKLPDAVWIVDTVKEHIAVQEANRLGIPVVAVVDTNCDPDQIDFVIPGNDDAIRSGALLTKIIADACAEGYMARASRTSDDVISEQAAAITAAVAAGAAAVQTGRSPPPSRWPSGRSPCSRRRPPRQRPRPALPRGPPPSRRRRAPTPRRRRRAPTPRRATTPPTPIDVGADPAEAADAAGVAVDD